MQGQCITSRGGSALGQFVHHSRCSCWKSGAALVAEIPQEHPLGTDSGLLVPQPAARPSLTIVPSHVNLLQSNTHPNS